MGVIQKRNDKYRVLIRKAGHKAVSKTFTKKSIAQRWMTQTESAMEAGEFREDEQNFGLLINRYLHDIGRIKPIGRTKRHILVRLQDELGDLSLRDLTAETLNAFAVERGAAPATVMQDMIYIGVVLKTAESMWGARPKIDEYNKAMRTLKNLGVVAESNERDRRVSDSEIERILANTISTFPMEDLIWFAVHSAMRGGEVHKIRWEDLSEDGRTVIIRERKHPRVKRDQRVPLVPEAVEIIQRQPRVAAEIFPFDQRSVSAAFRRAAKRAGVKDVRWHDLRHEGVSRLFERGLDMMAVAVFSGHRDINMLRRYTHLSPEKILDSL